MTTVKLFAAVFAFVAGYGTGCLLVPAVPTPLLHADVGPTALCVPGRDGEHLQFDFTPLAEIEAVASTRTP